MRLLTRLSFFLCVNCVQVLCFFGSEKSWKGTTDKRSHTCAKKPFVGVCHPLTDAWFYDAHTNTCKQLPKGVCAGGNNLFGSLKKCTKTCIPLTKALTKICLHPPSMGQCGPFVVSWFFDRYSHHCKMFNHTVCGGGGNQFRSELQCQQVCRPKRMKARCSERPVPGMCFIGQKRFHFDVRRNTCVKFADHKCGSNNNAFHSFKKCMDRCSYNRAAMPCPKCTHKINKGQSFGITHGNGMLPSTPGPHGQPGYPFVPGEHLKPARFDTEGAPSMPSLPSRTNLPPPPAQVVSPYRPTIPGSHPSNNIPSEHPSIPTNTHRVLKPSWPNEPITKPVSPSVRGGPNTPIQGGQPSKPFDLSDAL
uniref:Pancreatic trypsin inhibitor n=1 Tax=Rhipicephalus zambeziensis TaxID=60191 RepID=A0A224Y2J4_9ACAR